MGSLTIDEKADLELVLSDAYCVRCNSTVGGGHTEGFCTVCWKRRKPLPLRLVRLLEALRDN